MDSYKNMVELISLDSDSKGVFFNADEDSILVFVAETMSECDNLLSDIYEDTTPNALELKYIDSQTYESTNTTYYNNLSNSSSENEENSEEESLLIEKISTLKKKPQLKRKFLNDSVTKFFNVQILSRSEQIVEFEKKNKTENYVMNVFKCDQCYTGFSNSSAFAKHLRLHSKNHGNFVCDICKMRFHNKIVYDNHIETHKYMFTCKKCHFKSYKRMHAKRHIKYHNGVEPKCDICMLSFAVRQFLLNHNRKMHRLDHICAICGYSFLGEHGLRSHVRLKHGPVEIPVNGEKCDECNITFASEEALSTHRNTSYKHGGGQRIRTFLISSCKKAVIGNNIRTTDVPCEQCDEVFKTMKLYKLHFDSRHHHIEKNQLP